VTNFMGGKLSVGFIAGLEPLSGSIEDIPIPGNCHGDALEWLGTLRAVQEARDRFAMIELGAGWAPWCAIGHQGARMRGIDDIRVVALEADAGHIGFIEEHFRTNGVPPQQATILHGAAGPEDGIAEFPRHRAANSDYGGAAAFGETAADRAGLDYFVGLRGDNVAEIERLPAHALATLLAGFDRVDLVHCDIQGAELEVLSAGMAAATAKVRRVVVGTHSFAIDRAMLALFARAGWECEGMFAVEMQEQGKLAVTVRDGCQVWRNPKLGG
jgi:FkbM family methyltransferase